MVRVEIDTPTIDTAIGDSNSNRARTMIATENRQFLQRELVEMDHLIALSAGDPVMALALKNRRASLESEIQHAPPNPPKPRTMLFFAGPPVLGSQGIDAEFAASALGPFLKMVKTQYSAQKHGKVGTRSPRKDESEAKLLPFTRTNRR